MLTAPHSPSEHHLIEAEQAIAGLGHLGPDEPERLVETLVGSTHAVLSIASTQMPRAAHPSDHDFGTD